MSRARALLAAAAVCAAVTLPVALVLAPPDAVQGQAQRWMYLHVPAAWCAYACFAYVLVKSVQVLRSTRAVRRHTSSGGRVASAPAHAARAGAEVGLVLAALTLLTGSLWGRLTWGVWWAWDARVLTTVAMGCVYAAYLAVVHLERERALVRRPLAPVIGVVGFAVVPIVHMSVVWWRTLHQPPTILAPGSGLPIDPAMAFALVLSVLTLSLATGGLVVARTRALVTPPARVPPPPKLVRV